VPRGTLILMGSNLFTPQKTLVIRWIVTAVDLFFLVMVLYSTVGSANDDLHLPPPTFPDVVEAFQGGQVADALAIFDRQLAPDDGDQSIEALILRATLFTENGQPQKAEALWRIIIEREVWMRTFARRALVTSLAGRGSAKPAELILSELIRSDASRHLDLTLRVADTYRELGDTRAARRLYQQVLNRQNLGALGDAARLGTAASWELDGDVTAALNVLRETKLSHRNAKTFQVAAAAERRLLDVSGDVETPFNETEYRTLVRRLRNAARFKPALALIDKWHAAYASNGQKAEIESERITTLYVQRANAAAVAACQTFYEQFPNSSLVPAIRLTDFRLAVRVVDTNRARRLGLDLWEGRVPGATPDQRRDAAILLAAFLVAVGDVSEGLALYRQLFASSLSADDQRAVLWRAGVAALRDGQHGRALTSLRALIDRNPSGELAPAGLYWLGVAESQDDIVAGAQRLEGVARRFPYHYYGMRARERLERLTGNTSTSFGAPTLTFPQLTLRQGTTERAEYRAATVLARAGLVNKAAWYLRRLLAERGDRGLALLAARASADAGDYASVTRILVNHFAQFLVQPANGLPGDFWTLVYPRPFWDEVRHAGATHGVDPLLLVSLMRQESRFDPDARSTVGAIGLFQIMTYTAEALAPRAGLADALGPDTVDESVLAQPAVNSAIAATLVSDLLGLFDGAAEPVAASYNAGQERVAVWWDTSRELTADFFVDTIPYSETRRFVREVLANRSAYERLYGGQ